jgi:O-antigen ligase
MLLGTVLFLLFAILASAGAYFITAHQRSRRAGLVAALVTAIFFVALFAGVLALLRGGGAL